MDLRILEFTLILAFVKQVGSFPAGCSYKGTIYKEGEVVRTEDPCLSCICHKGALDCNLQVCTEHANSFTPGCFLLHKPYDCCPQLLCDERFNPSGIELRTEYKLENEFRGNDCVINGSFYAGGSSVSSSQPCEYCYCVQGEMKCLKPRCLQSFEGCKPAYEKFSCCPTYYDCRDANLNILTTQMKHFVLGNVDFTILNNSLRSLSSLRSEPRNESLHLNENLKTDLKGTKRERVKEMTAVVIEERNLEETTVEQEGMISLAEENITDFGEEHDTIPLMDESALASASMANCSSSICENIKKELDAQSRNEEDKLKGIEILTQSSNESHDSGSQEDYDSYDYSEPRLPPSLPNLVIFPFVAADAMVKDKSVEISGFSHKEQTEKTGSHYVFYKDYFSPPLKTEGGFVPKESQKSEESFYESTYLKEEQIELPKEGIKEKVSSQANAFRQPVDEMNFQKIAGKQETKATSDSYSGGDINVAFNPSHQHATPLDSDTALGFPILNETLIEGQFKKPVTVTYKNFIIDFYPNYLITTAKGTQTDQAQLDTEESFVPPTQKPQDAISPSNATSEAPLAFSDVEKDLILAVTTRETPMENTLSSSKRVSTSETSFFDQSIESFLSEEIISTTTVPSMIKKHKFSSKIKNQLVSTEKSKREKISQKMDLEASTEKQRTSFPAPQLPNIEKLKLYSDKRKPAKKDSVTGRNETSKPIETKDEKAGLFQVLEAGNPLSKNKISEADGKEGRVNLTAPNVGTLLKLAGCNIYGMMYRVGKVITELSGPCLECLCTDLGVQCRSLKC